MDEGAVGKITQEELTFQDELFRVMNSVSAVILKELGIAKINLELERAIAILKSLSNIPLTSIEDPDLCLRTMDLVTNAIPGPECTEQERFNGLVSQIQDITNEMKIKLEKLALDKRGC